MQGHMEGVIKTVETFRNVNEGKEGKEEG